MLIDSEKLTARYCKAHCGHHAEVCGNPCETVRFIREEPEAVVRCEECKHYREEPSQTRDNAVVIWCAADRYPRNDVMPDDWFCASGRRKEDNNG